MSKALVLRPSTTREINPFIFVYWSTCLCSLWLRALTMGSRLWWRTLDACHSSQKAAHCSARGEGMDECTRQAHRRTGGSEARVSWGETGKENDYRLLRKGRLLWKSGMHQSPMPCSLLEATHHQMVGFSQWAARQQCIGSLCMDFYLVVFCDLYFVFFISHKIHKS